MSHSFCIIPAPVICVVRCVIQMIEVSEAGRTPVNFSGRTVAVGRVTERVFTIIYNNLPFDKLFGKGL